VLGGAAEEAAAVGEDLFRGLSCGRERVCAGAGVFEGQVGAVDGEQVPGAVEVAGQQDDVAASAVETANLVAAQLPPRARAVASLQAATADSDFLQRREANDAQQNGNAANDWSSISHVVGLLW